MFLIVLISALTGILAGFLYGMFFVRCLNSWYHKNNIFVDNSPKISKRLLLSSAFSYTGRYLLLACFLFFLTTRTTINVPLFITCFGFSFWSYILARSWFDTPKHPEHHALTEGNNDQKRSKRL